MTSRGMPLSNFEELSGGTVGYYNLCIGPIDF
jgi:hypothetical protein